jgi:peptide subunit release factor 1 (eRF1)
MQNIHVAARRTTMSAGPEDRLRIQQTLKRLAARGPSPWPVLSVYVNTRPVGTAMTTYRQFLKKRLSEEIKAFKARSPEHESLTVDAARVQHYLDYDVKESTRGTAVFACYGDGDLFDAVQVPVEFPDQLVTVGPLATLYPLLRVSDCYRRAAVLLSDTHSARLFTIALGTIEIRREVKNPPMPRVKGAGELDSAHQQRHAEEHWKQHVRQAVHALEELANESQAAWILLGADQNIGPELEAALSPATREFLLGRFGWDIRIPEAELAESVQVAVEAREKEMRRLRAEELVRSAPHDGAILGVEQTVEALLAARVASLVLSEALPPEAPGWACRACRAFGAGPAAAACPVCGRAEAQSVSLREELGSQGLAQGAEVHFVESRAVPAFDAQGGVGAFARYP